MNRRKPLRIARSYDEYVIKTGTAGFVQLFKNDKRIAPKSATIVLRKRKKDAK